MELRLVLAAVLLDLLLGDPRWLPHPVVFIGKADRSSRAAAPEAVP